LKGVRDRALLAILIGCGQRRAEAAILSFHHIEQREGRWAIVEIVGKRDKMRTAPMSSWAKACMDTRKTVAHLEEGFVFRRVNKGDLKPLSNRTILYQSKKL
jgi:site-specific recombinase XerD